MSLENILSQEIVQKLGWTLLHFVWQATAVALLAAILLAGLRKATAGIRYIIACTAMGLIVLLPAATIVLVPVSPPRPIVNTEPSPTSAIAPVQATEEMPLAGVVESQEPVQPQSINAALETSWRQRVIERLEPALPYLVTGWLIGVFGLSLWHLGGWAQLQRLRRKLTRPVDAALAAAMRQLADRLGVNRALELLESALVQVPTVVGWLRPVILLPASALTGLSTEQLEALLAHELAHIRRHDYLVNILQTVIETLGFYHPAVWWVSHRIRIERENCCDDLAVGICGDRLRYARALTSMEEIRSGRGEFAIAASGGNLLARIHRLVGKDTTDSSRTSWIPSAITILLIAMIMIPTTLALTANSKPQQAEEAVDPQESSAERQEGDPNAWQEKFHSTYRLEEGQVLKRIRPPFIPERIEYFKSAQPRRRPAKVAYEPAKSYIFNWDGNLNFRSMLLADSRIPRFDVVLANVIELRRSEYDIPLDILNLDMSGDWIIRKDTPQQELLDALEKIIKDETGRDIDFVKRKVETKAIIARGTYRLTPLADAKEKDCIHVYTDKLDTDRGAGGGHGPLDYLLEFVGDYRINMIIIDKTESGSVEVSWRDHYSSDFGQLKNNEQLHNEKVDLLLKNLTQQTALIFSRETATVEKWFVREKGSVNAPQKADAPAESDEGRIEGQIIDLATGRGISGVQLAVVPQSSPTPHDRFVGTSEQDGKFAIGSLPSGEYAIQGDFPSVDVDIVSGRCMRDVLIGVNRGETMPAPKETTAEQQSNGQIIISMRVIEMPADAIKDVFEPNESLLSGLFVRHGHEIASRLLTLTQERKDVKQIDNPRVLMNNNENSKISIITEGVYVGGYESVEGEPGKLIAQPKTLEVGWTYKIHARILESGEKLHMELAAKHQKSTFETREYRKDYDYQIPSPPEFFVADVIAKSGEPLSIVRLRPGEPTLCLIITTSALGPRPQAQPDSLLGKRLPEPDNIQYIDYVLKQVEGLPILVCFWDMQQRPSRNLIGELAKRDKTLQAKGIVGVLVHTSKVEAAKLKEWLDDHKISFACGSIKDDDANVMLHWGVRAQPWLILRDKEGIVQAEGLSLEQLDEKLQGSSSNAQAKTDSSPESRQGQTPGPNDPMVAKSAAPSGADKAQMQTVRVELSVVEVSSDSRMDGETTVEIENLLGGKVVLADSRAVADLLAEAAGATAPAKDESAGDKRVTQEQFDKLFDVLVSRGYLKILLRPTLEVVEGQTAQIKTDRNSLEVFVRKVKDNAIDLQVQADLSTPAPADGNDQTPMFSTRSFSTRVYVNSGQSLVIGGLIRPASRRDAESNAEASQPPAKELMCILTASITTPPADANQQGAAVDKNQVIQKSFKLKHYSPSEAARMVGPLLGKAGYVSADEKTGTLVVVDTAENLKPIERIISILDAARPARTVTEIFDIRYADPLEIVESLKKALSVKTDAGSPTASMTGPSGQPVVLIPEPRRNWIIAKASVEDMKMVRERIEQLDQPDTTSNDLETTRDDFEVFRPRIVKLQNSVPAEMAKLLTALFAEESAEGVNLRDVILGEDAQKKPETPGPLGSHFTFEEVPGTSAIVVVSNIPEAYDAVEQLVLELDKQKMADKDIKQVRQWIAGLVKEGWLRAPKSIDEPTQAEQEKAKTQILIETRILYVMDDFLRENRLDANSVRTAKIRSAYPIAESAAEPNSPPYCLILDDRDVNQLLEAVAAARQDQSAKVFAAPQAMTLDGEPITMKINRSFVLAPSGPNDAPGEEGSKPQYVDAGTFIKVTPDALPDSNNVLLNLEWESSQFRGVEQRVGPDGKKQTIPVIIRDDIKTTATVPDGKTLLIGRMKILRWVVTRTKMPLLGDLPLIGSLFLGESRVEEARNILILVKPTISPKT